jgi:hypothetical protein
MGIGVAAMSAGLKGKISSLTNFSKRLREIPRVLAPRVSEAVAPRLTEQGRETFNAGQDPWGTPWEPSVDGQAVTLRKSGALLDSLRYIAIGTLLRVSGLTAYAKYQIGRRRVLPAQGAPLPPDYAKALNETASEKFRELMEGSS